MSIHSKNAHLEMTNNLRMSCLRTICLKDFVFSPVKTSHIRHLFLLNCLKYVSRIMQIENHWIKNRNPQRRVKFDNFNYRTQYLVLSFANVIFVIMNIVIKKIRSEQDLNLCGKIPSDHYTCFHMLEI
jgi:hypothetical protein